MKVRREEAIQIEALIVDRASRVKDQKREGEREWKIKEVAGSKEEKMSTIIKT